jgi:hypothetical protein
MESDSLFIAARIFLIAETPATTVYIFDVTETTLYNRNNRSRLFFLKETA